MPVVTVVAAPHPAAGALVIAIAGAVATALDLDAGDVIATHIPSGVSAVSGADAASAVSAWPVVSIHGSDRGRERMDAARAAAEAAVRTWCTDHEEPCEGVWTQWLLPMP
jgi:hypothetical protein